MMIIITTTIIVIIIIIDIALKQNIYELSALCKFSYIIF